MHLREKLNTKIKAKKGEKRKLSLENEENDENQPCKKMQKLDDSFSEENLNESFNELDNITDKSFKSFLKKFSIPTMMYRYISNRNNKVMLQRNLFGRKINFFKDEKPKLKDIADQLSTIVFHEQTNNKSKGRLPKMNNKSTKYTFTIKEFVDSKAHKDWKTVKANIYVDAIYFIHDKRKNKKLFHVERLIANKTIPCTGNDKPKNFVFEVDVHDILNKLKQCRVRKILLNFKILAEEIKINQRTASDKSPSLYPVTYDTVLPIFKTPCDDINQLIKPGNYELFLTVTNMEKCDDTPFEGNIVEDDDDGMSDKQLFNSQWTEPDKRSDMELVGSKLLFSIDCAASHINATKKMATRNNSLLPIINNSPNKVGPLKLKQENAMMKPCKKIIYSFYDGDNVIQWTKTNTISCPWCNAGFLKRYPLIKAIQFLLIHLNYMHSKFDFRCDKVTNKMISMDWTDITTITIEVRLAEIGQETGGIGLVFNEQFPMRRMPCSEIIFNRYEKKIEKVTRPNHNRQYYHSWTASKMLDDEFDIDSEGEENYEWIKEIYFRRTEDLLDINHVEKRIIELWNLSLLNYGYYITEGNVVVFVEYFMDQIISKEALLNEMSDFRNNLMLHLVNLIDFGLLPTSTFIRCMEKFDNAVKTLDSKKIADVGNKM